MEVLNARFAQKELANPNIPAILQALVRLAMSESQEESGVSNKGIARIHFMKVFVPLKNLSKIGLIFILIYTPILDYHFNYRWR